MLLALSLLRLKFHRKLKALGRQGSDDEPFGSPAARVRRSWRLFAFPCYVEAMATSRLEYFRKWLI